MDNVKILDINLNRNNFTQHGLHLNTVGKARVAGMIVKNIKQLMDKTKNIPIILDWKGNPKDEWPKSMKLSPHQRLC
jgi:Cu/Ag efflux pump CusA